MKNKILEPLKENDDLLSRVFWKKNFYLGVEGLNNPKHPVGKLKPMEEAFPGAETH